MHDTARAPPNVHFEVDDAEADWTYSNSFNYIHCRYMGNAIQDWARLTRQCFECGSCSLISLHSLTLLSLSRFTASDGYTELLDLDLVWRSPDNTMRPTSICSKMNAEFLKASRAAGFEPCPGPLLEGYLKDAGFADVKVKKFAVPIGPWALDPHMVSYKIPIGTTILGCSASDSGIGKLLTRGARNTSAIGTTCS